MPKCSANLINTQSKQLSVTNSASSSTRIANIKPNPMSNKSNSKRHSSFAAIMSAAARSMTPATSCNVRLRCRRGFSVQNPFIFLTLLVVLGLCANLVASSPATQLQQQRQQQRQVQQQVQQQQLSTVRIQQCREGCFEKFATKEILCQQNPECLTCWDECAKPPPPKINKSIRETWSLHTVSMLQQDSLVLVDVAWIPLSTPNQCLVTWEVSGGGLMGNLLTESFNVQLSLWPDTKYRVQVTCKNKLTGAMSRSLPLTIDTAEAITPQENTEQQQHSSKQSAAVSSSSASSFLQPVATKLMPTAANNMHDIAGNSIAAAVEPVDNSAEQHLLPISDNVEVDDQSAEAINQHTNFVFNWHSKNSDISDIEPMDKPELNIFTVAAFTDWQKPLFFGIIAGTLLLSLILLVYIGLLRFQNAGSSDKAALIEEDDAHAVIVALPPPPAALIAAAVAAAAAATSRAGSSAAAASASASGAASLYRSDDVCKNAATCSRNALKV